MKKTTFLSFFIVVFVVICFACQKPKKYPIEPHLEFVAYYAKKDTADEFGNKSKYLKLTFALTDGDGDIGFEEDMISPEGRSDELYSTIFYKQNGEFYEYNQYLVNADMILDLKKMSYPKSLIDSLEVLRNKDKEKAHTNAESIDFLFNSHLNSYDYQRYHEFLISFSQNTNFLYYEVPYVEESTGQNKSLKTDLLLEVFFSNGNDPEVPYDTLIYETYIYDRMMHKSNIVRTAEIIFE